LAAVTEPPLQLLETQAVEPLRIIRGVAVEVGNIRQTAAVGGNGGPMHVVRGSFDDTVGVRRLQQSQVETVVGFSALRREQGKGTGKIGDQYNDERVSAGHCAAAIFYNHVIVPALRRGGVRYRQSANSRAENGNRDRCHAGILHRINGIAIAVPFNSKRSEAHADCRGEGDSVSSLDSHAQGWDSDERRQAVGICISSAQKAKKSQANGYFVQR